MLSAPQIFAIETLPAEGGCYYLDKGVKIPYAEDVALKLAHAPLQKLKPLPDNVDKEVIILHGAPGAGKSFAGINRLDARKPHLADSIAVISYDEAGAIYDIPEYVQKLKALVPELNGQHQSLSPERALATMDARHQLWLDFQPLSQHIRSLTFKEALRRELPLFIDTTSSSPGTFRMIETLRDLDYKNVEVWSVHGSLDLAKNRIVQRARPTSNHDYLAKRVGAYETLPHLCGEADRMVITLNESNTDEPIDIVVLEYGQVRVMDTLRLNYLTDRLARESAQFAELAQTHLPDVRNLDGRYLAATEKFRHFIESYNPNSRSQLAQYYYHQEMGRQP